jgi:hypothetical protein
MKKTLLIVALLASFGAHAQTANSGSNSGSNSGADSASTSGVSAVNSGTTTAIGNQNASRSDSASQSGAQSGSLSGAVGNTVIFNPSSAGATAQGAGGIPTTRIINERSGTDRTEQVLSGTTTANQNSNSVTRNTDNINYSGTVENKASGGTYNVVETRQSGTTTVKMAPAIAMSGPASGPCTGVSGGVGLSGPGWGVGFNGSSVMDDCRMRENTRVLGMGMQSLDGQNNPQEKGEATVMFMDAMRNLAAYNNTIYSRVSKEGK